MANDQKTGGPDEPARPPAATASTGPKPDQAAQQNPEPPQAPRENGTSDAQDDTDSAGKDDKAGAAADPGTTQGERIAQLEHLMKVEPEPPRTVVLPDDPQVKVDPAIAAEIEDGLSLLEFAIASGFTTTTGHGIHPDVVTAIKRTAVKSRADNLKLSDWVNFETNYHWLATVVAPVSAETLRNTREQHGSPASPARRFAWSLWGWTAAFAFIIIAVELGQKTGGAPETPALASDPPTRKEWLDSLMHFGLLVEPYAYGGLGACAYLLRSAHMYIYTRTFDLRRRSEYYNRIILGLVAGGAIFLFVSGNTGEESTAVQLSSGALAFIAGYSNDFLFTAIQRIVNALFPKTDGERPLGSPRAPAEGPPAGPPSPPLGKAGGQQ
jgi:hypothetical protein